MAYFNINSVINFKYYDYIKSNTNSVSELLRDTEVYWNPREGTNPKGYSSTLDGKSLNYYILTKASVNDTALSEDYILGNAYNLFMKGFSNSLKESPSTINTYVVEIYKDYDERGKEIVKYRLPKGGKTSGKLPANTDPKFYDNIPVYGVVPINMRGALQLQDVNGHTISLGEKDIVVRRLNHNDIEDFDEVFNKYLTSATSSPGSNFIIYTPDNQNLKELYANYIDTSILNITDGQLSGTGQFSWDGSVNISGTTTFTGPTYIQDLYTYSEDGDEISLTDYINTVSVPVINSSLKIDIGEELKVGGAVNGYEYETGTKIETILRDILQTRYCTQSYTTLPSFSVDSGYSYHLADGTTLSSGNEICDGSILCDFSITYNPGGKEGEIHGPRMNVKIGDDNSFVSTHGGGVISKTIQFNNVNATLSNTTVSVSSSVKCECPNGTISNGASLIIDSKNCYNGLPGSLTENKQLAVTWSSNIQGKGYGKGEYNSAAGKFDAAGNELMYNTGWTENLKPANISLNYPMFYKTFLKGNDGAIPVLTDKEFDGASRTQTFTGTATLVNGWSKRTNVATISNVSLQAGTKYMYIVVRGYTRISSCQITSNNFTSAFSGHEKLATSLKVHYWNNQNKEISGYSTFRLTWPDTNLVEQGTTVTITFAS